MGWPYNMMTSSNGNISRVTGPLYGNSPATGEFPAQRPVTRSFDVFVDLRQHKRLSKHSLSWWFETPSRSLWRQRNDEIRRVPLLALHSYHYIFKCRQFNYATRHGISSSTIHFSHFAVIYDTIVHTVQWLQIAGKLWGVFCDDFWENWSYYNGIAPYLHQMIPHDFKI